MLKQRAFTLIELLVVIAVIGLLSSIVLLNMNLPAQRQRAGIAKTLEFSQSIQNALGAEAVGIWNFDNNTLDSSGYGNNGTNNGAVFTADTPQRIVGQGSGKYALSFDGINDYVSVPDSPSWNFGSGDFTIESWANFRSVAGTQNFISQYGDNGSNGSFAFVMDGGATLMFFWSTTGSSELRIDGNWRPSLNTWYHIIAVRSGDSLKTYVNTIRKSSGTLSGTIYNSSRNLNIGAYRDGGQFFNGLIDEVRIYKQALTLSQIQKHYAEGLAKHYDKFSIIP